MKKNNIKKIVALYSAAILLLPILSALNNNIDNQLTFYCDKNVKGNCLIEKLKLLADSSGTKVRIRRSFMNSGKCATGYHRVLFKCLPCQNSTCDPDASDY